MADITPGKGLQGENCNRTACQAPKSANHYNKETRKWYCFKCACTIEAYAQIDNLSFYPGTVADLIEQLSHQERLQVARCQLTLPEPEAAK